MLIGQSLLCTAGVTYTYLSPWFPRGANAAMFVYEVMYASGDFTLTINIQHKNSEDPDSSAANLGAPAVVTSPGTVPFGSFVGFKELVRYVFELTCEEDAVWIHMRMNPPIWQPN